jgi:hypothetical protein
MATVLKKTLTKPRPTPKGGEKVECPHFPPFPPGPEGRTKSRMSPFPPFPPC